MKKWRNYIKCMENKTIQPPETNAQYLGWGPSLSGAKMSWNRYLDHAHDLMIERGHYFKPVIPRNQRVCLNCEQVEEEIHFMLFWSKFKDLRILLLARRLNIHTHDLRPNTVEAFSVFSKLLNLTKEKDDIYLLLVYGSLGVNSLGTQDSTLTLNLLALSDKDLVKCTCADLKCTSPDLKCANFQIL